MVRMSREEAAVEDVYRAPLEDDDAPDVGAHSGVAALYMPPNRVAVMYVLSLGLYGVYWFYSHWSFYKRALGMRISPVGRAIFSVFFVNQLFKSLYLEASRAGYRPSFNPSNQAGLYIAFVVGSRLLDRFDSAGRVPIFSLLAIAVGLAGALPLVSAQKVANLVAGEEGARMARPFSLGEGIFACLGVILWGLMLAGLFMTTGAAVE